MRTYLDDTEGRTIQGFAPRSIENETITASGVYTLDTTSLVAVQFYASAELRVSLNNTAAYFPCRQELLLIDPAVNSISWTNASSDTVSLYLMEM